LRSDSSLLQLYIVCSYIIYWHIIKLHLTCGLAAWCLDFFYFPTPGLFLLLLVIILLSIIEGKNPRIVYLVIIFVVFFCDRTPGRRKDVELFPSRRIGNKIIIEFSPTYLPRPRSRADAVDWSEYTTKYALAATTRKIPQEYEYFWNTYFVTIYFIIKVLLYFALFDMHCIWTTSCMLLFWERKAAEVFI